MDVYDVGDAARLDLIELKDEDGNLADPVELSLEFQDPAEAEPTVWVYGGEGGITKEKTGYYHALLQLTSPGVWLYRWIAKDGVTLTEGGAVRVRVSGLEQQDYTRAPTVGEVREWSRMDFDDLEFEPGEGQSWDPLEPLVLRASAWLQHVTGRSWASLQLPEEPMGENVSDEQKQQYAEDLLEMQRIRHDMRRALVMLVEYDAAVAQPEIPETAADFGMIQSFSAGSYSETRRTNNRPTNGLHPWTALDELLWGLLTPKRRAGRMEGPAIRTDSAPYWRTGADILGYRDELLTPFGRFAYPWDAILLSVY